MKSSEELKKLEEELEEKLNSDTKKMEGNIRKKEHDMEAEVDDNIL